MLQRNYKFRMACIYLGIKIFGTLFAIFVFNRFTPLIDSMNYINNYYYVDDHIRTLMIQHITTFLVSLSNPLATHIIFSLFSASSVLYYSSKSKSNSWLLLILLFPSALIWTSIVGKEAIYYGCVGIFLILWIDLIKEKLSYRHLILIILLVICSLLRPHYSISLLWLGLSAIAIKNNKGKNNWLISFTFLITIVGIIYFLLPELAEKAYGLIDRMARASRNVVLNIYTLEDFKSKISTGMLFGIIGPLPSEIVNRPEFLPFLIEGILVLIVPFVIGFILFRETQESKDGIYLLNWIYGVIPAIIILVLTHGLFGISNPGSAIRWRVNFELIFYMAPLLLLLESRKND